MSYEIPTKSGVGVIAGQGLPYLVRIRRDIGRQVRPEAEEVDGKVYVFRFGWVQGDGDQYPGEKAMVPNDFDWPADAPPWMSEGDCLLLGTWRCDNTSLSGSGPGLGRSEAASTRSV